MDIAYTIVSIGGPIILGLMGVIVAEYPPTSRRWRASWYSAFLIVALVSIGAAIADKKSGERRLEEMLIGGDNYGYLWAEVGAAQDPSSSVPLWFKATGLLFNVSYWISPAYVSDPNDKRYWSIGGGFLEETRGGIRIGRTLPVGKYRITFEARNGSFIQILDIKPSNNGLIQKIQVFRHKDGEIYTEETNVTR